MKITVMINTLAYFTNYKKSQSWWKTFSTLCRALDQDTWCQIGIGKYQVMDGIRKVDGSLPFESRLEGLDSNSIFILKITNVYDTAVSSSGDISKLLK